MPPPDKPQLFDIDIRWRQTKSKLAIFTAVFIAFHLLVGHNLAPLLLLHSFTDSSFRDPPRNVAVYNLSNLFKAALLSVDCNFQLVALVVDCRSSSGPVWLRWANYRGV